VRTWRGIRYARAERFGPPEVVPYAGEHGGFGPVAVQARGAQLAMIGGVADKVEMSEDCLFLNIVAPDGDGPHPVLVWIHGGAFVMGSGSNPLYDGRSFAEKHGIVVVTINYRLGLLGFHKGNWCLRDQIAALTWVQRYIGQFGGDPRRVTAMGESAGAISIATLLAMPAAAGLFQRAILESGASPLVVHRESGLPRFDEAAPIGELLKLQAQRIAHKGLVAFAPYVDGVDLPDEPIACTRTDVPLLLGHNRDEWKLFAQFLGDASVTPVIAALDAKLPNNGLLDAYRGDKVALLGDLAFRIPMLRLAEKTPSFFYRFDWQSPAMGGALGAAHAMELPFVWNALGKPAAQFLGATNQALADEMHDRWAAFARTGDPGWPRYGDKRTTMIFDTATTLVDDPEPETRRAWATALATISPSR